MHMSFHIMIFKDKEGRCTYSHIKNRIVKAKKKFISHMVNFERKETNISYMNSIIHIGNNGENNRKKENDGDIKKH